MSTQELVVDPEAREELIRRLSDDAFVTAAIARAVREAVREHKRAGNPVAGWQDGRVVIVQPEDIPDFEDQDEDAVGS